ncbi:MAG TPA: hypothetical protein VGF55_25370 [Gemmataceae bacterium]|jgi:hypothetical protein
MNDPATWLLALLPALFAVLWCGVLLLIGRMGGWSRLAAAYRHDGRFDGYRTRFASGELRGPLLGLPCNYGGCLTLGSNPDGLYLAVLPLFRPGHPPLFIPWQDVTAEVKQGWLTTSTTFAFRRAPAVRLRVAHRLARRLVESAGVVRPLDLDDEQAHATQL